MLQYAPSASELTQRMLRIRAVETALQRLCDSGELPADLHFTTGQEAISVGVCAALEARDMVLCHHRMIGWAISKGVPLRALLAELMGKATGINGGLAGEMHMQAPQYGFLHSFQLVGTVIPVAAGVAWALKNVVKNGGIAVAVFGDAATANGQFHEGLNIAATQGLPLLMICENNHLAGNVTPAYYQPVEHIIQRASGYGIESAWVDGTDVAAVLQAAESAVAYTRRESAPFLLECDTVRLGRHKQGQGDIRSKEEKEMLWRRDPLRGLDKPSIELEVIELIDRISFDPEPKLPR